MLLDALEFDLTIADSTESEAGGHEPEAPEFTAIARLMPTLANLNWSILAKPTLAQIGDSVFWLSFSKTRTTR